MNKELFSVLLLLVITSQALAQSNVGVIGRAQDNRILLRWAPTDAVAWQYGLKYGYSVERYTIAKDSAMVKPPIKIKLVLDPIKPKPLDNWENLVETNDYAAVAAQAIYGETFELTEDYTNDITQIVQKTREQEQRFSFALFAADQSFKVAEMSGLGFVDNNVVKGEKYLYKVTAQVPDSVYLIKEGTVFIGLKDAVPLPKPIELQANFGNKTAHLKWNREFFEHIYNSFIVERSDDEGQTFKALNKKPLINTYEGDDPNVEYYHMIDSLPQNNKEYQYRVKGVTPFGEMGPTSDIVKGSGSDQFVADIGISGHKIIDNHQVELNWKFPVDKVSEIKGFVVQRSNSVDGPYIKIHRDTLSVNTRLFIDKKPISTAYYKVAYVNARHSQFSHPYLVQLEDSIPPTIPTGMKYIIDTTGIVKLKWNDNTESDLLGYRVYRSNFKNSEFIQITRKTVNSNQFVDTVALKNLTTKVYYKITSLDNRFNESNYSDAIEVIKPDQIPPVSPLLKRYQITNDTLQISWINSSSDDVSSNMLFMNDFKSNSWSLVKELPATQSDLSIPLKENGRFRYSLIAIDDEGNESEPCKPVIVNVLINTGGYLKDFKVIPDRKNNQIKLEWDIDSSINTTSVEIYRAVGEERLTLYKTITTEVKHFIDKKLNDFSSETYHYLIRVNETNSSTYSNEINVKY